MLALLYLIFIVVLGDTLCRRFVNFISWPDRLASAFLTGLLVSSWATYLSARVFANSSRPLFFGNLLFILAGATTILFLKQRRLSEAASETLPFKLSSEDKRDLSLITLLFVVACWMMFGSFNMEAGKLQIANHQWSDFGPNVALMQSFALGHNFPTEYPHFSGDRIRYHFLFYFQAGNLEYLGLNPAWANNLLSVLSLVAMLALVMVLGVLLFRTHAVGRIAAALFFFNGSLNYISFFRKQESIAGGVRAAKGLAAFLPSGFPYRGEDWGVWSLVNFINQRHFASSIGILLLVLVFLVKRYQADLSAEEDSQHKRKRLFAFIFFGALLGLLPMWNAAVFISAIAVLGTLFILFPFRKEMLALGGTAAIVALPQIIYLKTGSVRVASYSLFHWGYTIENPTPVNVVKYLGWTFGFKWLLIAIALILATRFQRRVMISISSLLAIAFLFQFSEEVLANHKFLNVWLILANLFVAFGLWRLWTMVIKGRALPTKLAAGVLVVSITIGGVIDLFPIHNSHWVEIPFEGDRLVRWIEAETDPRSVFLTDRFVTHRIMLAGRRVFHGWPYYAWGAGYLAAERDTIYQRLFEERDANALLQLLQENNISYVAIDYGVRNGGFIKNLNEAVYEQSFEKVFQDTENQYDGLSIFKVPARGQSLAKTPAPLPTSVPANADPASANAFKGGTGKGPAQFDKPRGMTLDTAGNLYVADGGNSRIQKFSPQGDYLASFGKAGSSEGDLGEPSGVAVDAEGNLYVTDALNQRLIKFDAAGKLIKQFGGPEPGFYGPRDITFGPDKLLYVLDQGRSSVVKMNVYGETLAQWGRSGSGDGEFNNATGIAVAGNRVYVADAGNNRIQVFGADGNFIAQWAVPQWDKYIWHFPDLVIDERAGRVYVTSGWTKELLVFDMNGNYLESIKPQGTQALNNVSSIVLGKTKNGTRLYVLNTGTFVVDAGAPSVSIFDLGSEKRN